MVMMAHRVKRDIDRSRRKYGEAYKRYEKEVPYLFIPVCGPELPLYFLRLYEAANERFVVYFLINSNGWQAKAVR